MHTETLRTVFRTARERLNQMLDLLNREAAGLESRDAGELDRIAEAKQALVPGLEEVSAEQRDCLKALGWTEDGTDVSDFLAQKTAAGLPEDLLADWREILRLTGACRRQNEINGTYIGLLQRQVDNALEILHGPPYAEATYGPDGTKRRAPVSRRSFSV